MTGTVRITRVSPFRTARILAVMWALSGLVVAFFAQIPPWLRDAMGWMFVLYPLGYALFGFLSTLLAAWAYNLIAPRLGGVEWSVRTPGEQAWAGPMAIQVAHVAKLPAARVMGLFYLILGIPFAFLSGVAEGLRVESVEPLEWGMLALFGLGYAVFGFVSAFVGAWLYNGLAPRIGGIEFVVQPMSPTQ
jgi:hypothetical protein